MSRAKEIKLKDIAENDIVIAFMGPTGAGKSTFIDIATKQGGRTVGHSLESYTVTVRAVKFQAEDGTSVIFVDTPGFDDTNRSDTDVLNMISNWLEKTYRQNVKLAGLVYMHRISDNRMAGSPYKNLRMFANLCGDDMLGNVVLVTTMWSNVKPEVGAERERQLQQEFWKPMIDQGSVVKRFDCTYKRAWDIVNVLIGRAQREAVLLQEEIVDLGRKLSETEAGKTLYNALQRLLAEQKETVRMLQEEAKIQDNPKLAKELEKEYDKIQRELDKTFEDMKRLKIPFGRRFALLFSFKKAKSHSVFSPKS